MGDSPQGEVETKKEKTKKGNFIYRDTMALIGWETCCLLFWQTTVIQSGKMTRLNEKSFSLYCNFSCEHKTIIFMPLNFHFLFRCDIVPCCPEQGVSLHPNTQNPPLLRQLNVQLPARCFSPTVDETRKNYSSKTRLAETEIRPLA